MTFDSGTWWLIATIVAALVAAVTFLIKLGVFNRVDKCEKMVERCVLKDDYKRDIQECTADIKQIRRDYITRDVHAKDLDECRGDIKKIKTDYITKEDFLREMGKFDRKLDRQDEKIDRLINLLLRERGLPNE